MSSGAPSSSSGADGITSHTSVMPSVSVLLGRFGDDLIEAPGDIPYVVASLQSALDSIVDGGLLTLTELVDCINCAIAATELSPALLLILTGLAIHYSARPFAYPARDHARLAVFTSPLPPSFVPAPTAIDDE